METKLEKEIMAPEICVNMVRQMEVAINQGVLSRNTYVNAVADALGIPQDKYTYNIQAGTFSAIEEKPCPADTAK